MATMTDELKEQREQSDACIGSAESRQKKAEEVNQLHDELVEADALPLDEDELDDVAGGDPGGHGPGINSSHNHQSVIYL